MSWVEALAIGLLAGLTAFLVIVLPICLYVEYRMKMKIRSLYIRVYDVDDVDVFLNAIDADWKDFDKSITLRKTYADCRDSKQSLADIKKKKNTETTTIMPLYMGRML